MANDITLYRNDSNIIRCTVTDEAGDPFSLHEATVKFSVRETEDGTALLVKITGNGIAFHNEVGGVLDITIDANDTADMSDDYVYDIEVTKFSEVYTVVKGKFTVMKDVSHN
jgi:hypothetical protein